MTMTAVREEFVTLSHGRTRYLAAGTGQPVILLHGVGYTSGGDSWFLNIEPLAARLRVIAPDFVGWGLGDRLDREYSFAYLTDFVREFQDALGIERSHIVGHSMGGWIASLLAYESPNRVDRLVLVASGGTSTRTLHSMTEFSPPTRAEIRQQLEARIHAPVNLDELADRDMRKTEVPGALDSYRLILRHMNDPVNRARYNTLRRLPHITAPTLLVWGRDDQVNALAMGEETHRLVPDSRLAVLDSCGHSPPTERPEEFNRLILDFLTSG
jgi:pimeloyl-ACP methyl ester carboxylesterase